jgi:WD40 repeat protein
VLVTNAGVSAPSSQSIGTVHPFFVSGLRFSHDGAKLASCNYQASQIELFDFDYTTGLLSNPATHTFREIFLLIA